MDRGSTMGGVNIQLFTIYDKEYIPRVVSHNTMGRGFNTPWVGDSIYQGMGSIFNNSCII